MEKQKRNRLLIFILVPILILTAVAAVVTVKLTAKDPVFTLLWTSDPQWYSFKYPEIIEHQNEWIADNYKDYDIRYMFHTGDFVNLPHAQEEWAVMDESYKTLDASGLPYGVLAGNHDVDGTDHADYSKYFGESRYQDNKWYGGSFEDNLGHYDLMTIEGVDFIFVYMGYSSVYTDEHYEWMDGVLKEHSDRIAVLSFHEYMNVAAVRSRNGEFFFQRVVQTNPNVRLVLCGHNYNATRRVDDIDDDGDGIADRSVFQLMANYQSTTNGGNGFMRFMECDLENGTISSTTYSPYIDEYGSDYEGDKQIDEYGTVDTFTIPFDFSKPTAKPDGAPEMGKVIPRDE